MKSVGIDVGSYSIKVVEVLSTSKGFQVVQFHEHVLAPGSSSDQDLATIEFLRGLSSRYDHNKTRFIFGLRQDRVAIRNKFFPFSDRLKISKSLPFELEEDIPFSLDNAVYDAKIIRTVGAGAEVLACAAPKAQVQSCLQLSKDSGMPPFVISAEGTAFANVFEKWNEAPPATVAPSPTLEVYGETKRHLNLVLNIGHTRTLVTAFEGSSLVSVRSILWGGKNIAEAIAKKYEIPFLEAMKELQTKAFILTNKQGATFDQVTFSETIAKSVREMARDLQLSILERKSEFNADILSIGLTGGTSQIQNLGPFLTQLLEVPVNKVNTLDHFPNVIFERSPANSAKLSVALGLAVEGFKKPRNPAVNFMRGEFAPQNQYAKAFWEKWNHTIKIGATAFGVLLVYTYLREDFALGLSERAQEVLRTQARSVARLSGRNANESGIRKYIRDNKKRATDLKTLAGLAQMNSSMDILKKINDATPAKNALTLDVRSLEILESQVRMSGYLANRQEITLLQSALANITSDGKVTVLNTNLPTVSGKTAFSFGFNVDRGIQKVTR